MCLCENIFLVYMCEKVLLVCMCEKILLVCMCEKSCLCMHVCEKIVFACRCEKILLVWKSWLLFVSLTTPSSFYSLIKKLKYPVHIGVWTRSLACFTLYSYFDLNEPMTLLAMVTLRIVEHASQLCYLYATIYTLIKTWWKHSLVPMCHMQEARLPSQTLCSFNSLYQ